MITYNRLGFGGAHKTYLTHLSPGYMPPAYCLDAMCNNSYMAYIIIVWRGGPGHRHSQCDTRFRIILIENAFGRNYFWFGFANAPCARVGVGVWADVMVGVAVASARSMLTNICACCSDGGAYSVQFSPLPRLFCWSHTRSQFLHSIFFIYYFFSFLCKQQHPHQIQIDIE